ncbi:hypothetical protein FRB90_011831 [Tulasnella sp. 427]|nr:hypothetical protein FRB90_011831 [Tulasnella sp. 427]
MAKPSTNIPFGLIKKAALAKPPREAPRFSPETFKTSSNAGPKTVTFSKTQTTSPSFDSSKGRSNFCSVDQVTTTRISDSFVTSETISSHTVKSASSSNQPTEPATNLAGGGLLVAILLLKQDDMLHEMSESLAPIARRIESHAKEATVLPNTQARISNRATRPSTLVIQQLQALGHGAGDLASGLRENLDSFIGALQAAEDAIIVVEDPGFVWRVLRALWAKAQLTAAQEGIEKSYKQLAVVGPTSGPVDLPQYKFVGETISIPPNGLAFPRPKWSDVELLTSVTTGRASEQSLWASIFTAKVTGVPGTVMVKVYPGKKRGALAILRQDVVLLNFFQDNAITPTVLSYSAETSQTPFIVISGGAAVPFGEYLRRVCETVPYQAHDKAWGLITDILRVAPFLHRYVNNESLWNMIQPESLVVGEREKLITNIPSSAGPGQERPPMFNPLDVDLNEVLRSYFQHDLGLRPLRTLDIFPSMLRFTDRSNSNKPPPPPLSTKMYFINHPDPDGILKAQGAFPGDFGRFARGASGAYEFLLVAFVAKKIVIRLPRKAPAELMKIEYIERGLMRASFPQGLKEIRKYGTALDLFLRVPDSMTFLLRHGVRLAKEHRVPPWAWALVGSAQCILPTSLELEMEPCYLWLQPWNKDHLKRAYWTTDSSASPSTTEGVAELQNIYYTQKEDIDFADSASPAPPIAQYVKSDTP